MNLVAMVLKQNPILNDLARECADLIFSEIQQIRDRQGHVVVGLPGGRSTAAIYHIFKTKEFNWVNVHFFPVDERMVPLDHPDSNFKLIMDSFGTELIRNGKMSQNQFHPYQIGAYLEEYSAELKNFGGFDIIILGVGEDGHCAALFPNHHSIRNGTNAFFTMKDSPKPPPHRMTASRSLLLQAKLGIALFINETKLDALRRFLDNNIDIEQCPIKLVNRLSKHYEFTDLTWKT
jgi:6-phosphogluconolactonase